MANDLLKKLFKGTSVADLPDEVQQLVKNANFSGVDRPDASPVVADPAKAQLPTNFTGVQNAAGNVNNPVYDLGAATQPAQTSLFRGLGTATPNYPQLRDSLVATPNDGLMRPDQQPGYAPLTGAGYTVPNAPDPFNPSLYTAPAAPDATQPAYQRPSDQTYGQINALDQKYANGDPHGRHSLAARLFKGMGKAWQQWDGQGGIVGLATSMLGGGIGSATDPRNYAELEKRGEQNKLFRTLGMQQQREAWQGAQDLTNSKTANEYNQIGNRNVQTSLDIAKADRDRLNNEQKNLIDIWKASPGYKRGQNKGLDARIDAASLVLPDKEADGRYTGSYAPDGTYNVLNTKTGESVTKGNYAKPTTITEKELPDEMFGLMSEKDNADRAVAAVGKLPENRKLKYDITTRLPQFANPDGTFNEEKYWADYSNKETDIKPSDIYEKVPDNYEQNLASQRAALRDSQKDLRTNVATFRSALQTYKPLAGAVTLPLPKVVDGFKRILALPPKQRTKALKDYYEQVLPHIKVG